jgi:hypothetical protein
MLDLETWGKRPGCDLRSIGACVFDPLTGNIPCWDASAEPGHRLRFLEGAFYVATDNPVAMPGYNDNDCPDQYRKYPLTRDPETVQWWKDQSTDAQAAFGDPVDLRDALLRFALWLESLSTERPFTFLHYPDGINPANLIWSHGPTFDVSILDAAYHAVGLPVPWHYRAPRDTRTILEAAGMDPHKGLEPFNVGTHHHALDDAIAQARAVCAAYERLRAPLASLRTAVAHIDHMSVWIVQQNAGYSFERLGEDMEGIKAPLRGA